MTRLDPVTRKQKRKGNPIKHMLGDIVLVDCNVKGSDIGTPTDPKFALRTLWEAIILPAYDALTAVGGPAEGAVVVHQEDNAPPHQEGDFHAWFFIQEFTKRGWRLELQAPQGPYTNVLDLQVVQYPSLNPNTTPNPNMNLVSTCHLKVFPAMSKHHSHLLQMFNNTVAGYDRIWQVAQNVWKWITSAMVCRAFVLAYS